MVSLATHPCNFNLYYTWGPLPCTIKPETHIDLLLLRDSPVEDDTYDGFHCDECEKKRDPLLPVYHCKDCHYIAEIDCVNSEVMLTLKGGYGGGVECSSRMNLLKNPD